MKKEQGPDHGQGYSPRSARAIKIAIASIPPEVVEQAIRDGEKELTRKIAEIEERRRRELYSYVPHRFTI